MTVKQLGSFIGGLILAGLIYWSLLFIYVISTFSFAGERLTEKENRDAFCFFALLLIVGTTIFIIVRRTKTNRKYSAAGISVPLLVVVYGLIITGITYIGNLDYHRTFNRQKWDNAAFKPFKMAKTLVKEKKLIGISHKELFNRLGRRDNDYWNDKNYMVYPTDNPGWRLEIGFTNDKVESAYLYEGGFDD